MIRIKESTKNHKNQFERWLSYEDSVGRKGIDLVKDDITFVNDKEEADIGISWHGFSVKGVPRKKCILMKNEPPIYYAIFNRRMNIPNYNKRFLFAMSSHKMKGFEQYYYNIPRYEFNLVDEYFSEEKTKLLCMILRNKNKSFLVNQFSPGTKKYNKYSLIKFRQHADEVFCKISNLHLYNSYGGPWRHPCYCFKIPGGKKWQYFSKYQFTFCPENSRFHGYVTEKPIQPMCCGSIPVYYGAPDVENYIPKNCYIDYEEFRNVKKVYDYIKSMDVEECRKYRKNIKTFVTTKQSEAFSSYVFAKRFIKILSEAR